MTKTSVQIENKTVDVDKKNLARTKMLKNARKRANERKKHANNNGQTK